MGCHLSFLAANSVSLTITIVYIFAEIKGTQRISSFYLLLQLRENLQKWVFFFSFAFVSFINRDKPDTYYFKCMRSGFKDDIDIDSEARYITEKHNKAVCLSLGLPYSVRRTRSTCRTRGGQLPKSWLCRTNSLRKHISECVRTGGLKSCLQRWLNASHFTF